MKRNVKDPQFITVKIKHKNAELERVFNGESPLSIVRWLKLVNSALKTPIIINNKRKRFWYRKSPLSTRAKIEYECNGLNVQITQNK